MLTVHDLPETSPQASRPTEPAFEPPPPRRQPRAHLTYLVVALLLPLLAVPAFVELGRSDFFLHHGASVWVRANDAIFQMHGRTCNVLVFGDSTAMTGINPEIIRGDTGLSTCNIAVTNSVLAVTGNLTLDRFLARNPRPRALLIQLSPESFTLNHQPWEETVYPEGLLEMLRWGDPDATRVLLWTHPRETLAFAGYTAGYTAFYFIKHAWEHLTHTLAPEDAVVIRNGFFTAPLPPRSSCEAVPQSAAATSRSAASAFVADLRRRYQPQADTVFINVAPIPACDPDLIALQNHLRGLTSNTLDALPISLFNDERHYTAAGSTQLSHQLANQLQTALPPAAALTPR